MWERLSRVWGVPIPVSEILTMALYYGAGINLCTRAFATPISVSENAKKNLSESTHPIVSTRLMQMIMQLSSAADGMT